MITNVGTRRHWSRSVAAGTALLAILVISGCAAGQSGNPLNIDEIASETTEFQAEILADGKVTPAEYERALLAQRDCVIAAGGEPGELQDIGNGERGFEYSIVASTEEERVEREAATEACAPEYIEDVGLVWAYQNLLSPAELDDLRPQVAACLQGVGIDVGDNVTMESVIEAVGDDLDKYEAMRPCAEQFPEFFAGNPAERDVDTHEDDHQ